MILKELEAFVNFVKIIVQIVISPLYLISLFKIFFKINTIKLNLKSI